jgi:GxxExxY protein
MFFRHSAYGGPMGRRRELLFEELTGRVIGLYYDVYNTLGSGLLEPSYQEAMGIALTDAGLRCEREVRIQAVFRGRTIGQYRIDLVVERSVIIECKTSDTLSPNYHTQIRNYLRVSGLRVGLILLFGCKPATQRVIFDSARTPKKENDDIAPTSDS